MWTTTSPSTALAVAGEMTSRLRCGSPSPAFLAGLHQVHESTFLIFDKIIGSPDEERWSNLLNALRTRIVPLLSGILLISRIPEMQGECANTLIVGDGKRQREQDP